MEPTCIIKCFLIKYKNGVKYMTINLQNIRRKEDKKQKIYLRGLGYSENVINALFPKRKYAEIFLDNGSNLIVGFEIALKESKVST